MSTQYFQDEINYLRSLAKEFSNKHPTHASMFSTGAKDPDIDRLVESFAYLTARLHERLDNQYTQVAESYLSVLCPQLLRPIPSIAFIEISADRLQLKKSQVLKKGVQMHSRENLNPRIYFQTCLPLMVYPFNISKVETKASSESNELIITFELNKGTILSQSELNKLPINIVHDDARFTHNWYLWLTQYIKRAYFKTDRSDDIVDVSIKPFGFSNDELWLPKGDEDLPSHRILRQFFAFPEFFTAIKIEDISCLKNLDIENKFELHIDFGNKSLSGLMRDIPENVFKLHCVPAVNLFDANTQFLLDYTRREYQLIPNKFESEYYEIYSVESVVGTERGINGKSVEFQPFYNRKSLFEKQSKKEEKAFYRTSFKNIQSRQKGRMVNDRICYLNFEDFHLEESALNHLIMDIRLLCTNKPGTQSLKPNEILERSGDIPEIFTLTNIGKPTSYKFAPDSPQFQWLLVSSLASSKLSINNLDRIKNELNLFSYLDVDDQDIIKKWSDNLYDLTISPGVISVKGTSMRNLNIDITFDCMSEQISENYLFGIILCEYLRSMASINTRLDFNIKFKQQTQNVFKWYGRDGNCVVI